MLEPVPDAVEEPTLKSAMSRTYVNARIERLDELVSHRSDDERIVNVPIDGRKILPGVVEDSTEDSALMRRLHERAVSSII